MIEAFHFLRPEWLLCLIPLLAIGWLWLRKNQRDSGWDSAIDDELLQVLLDRGPRSAHRTIRFALLGALACGCIGAAGPTWEKLPQNVEQKDDALVILLDLSLSMLAEDVKPSRVERARQEITDVLRLREEGQTALIAYAGDAHAVVPLTDDTATISNLLASLSPEMMPVFGSNPDHALTLAHELFANSLVLQGRILMVTDGIDLLNDVTRHRNPAFPISVLGIGTEAGATIPLDRVRQPGRTLRTQEGNEVIAFLDEARLREAATLTYGSYALAKIGDADLQAALGSSLPGEDNTIEVEREFDTWFDQGHWLVVLILPLMLFAFRKGVFVGIIVTAGLVGFPAPPAHAESLSEVWSSLWQRDDQRAHQALRHGEPERAAALFSDPQWQSVAEYRSGNYATSLNGFAAEETIRGRYNEGNSLAQLGEYEAAITAYDDVLSRDPDHEDAAFNKALIERLLAEQQQQQQQEQDQQDQANNEDSDNEQQESEEQEQSEEEQESESSDQQEQDSEQQQEEHGQEQETAEAQEEESSRDEKQEALEQWLRRVPDDPGGLLKRKFSHETKQRLRSGDYEHRQGGKLW